MPTGCLYYAYKYLHCSSTQSHYTELVSLAPYTCGVNVTSESINAFNMLLKSNKKNIAYHPKNRSLTNDLAS